MSVGLFLAFLALGAAAIALWLDARFERLAPSTLRGTLVHVLVALGLGQLAAALLGTALSEPGSAVAVLAAVFGLGFPALTYCLLSSVWVIKALQGALRHR